jgi:hypothetical protein
VSPVTFFDIPAAEYLSAVRAFGDPGYTDSELAVAPESTRIEADRDMGAILGLRLTPGGASVQPCRTVQASQGAATGIALGPGRTTLATGSGSAAKVALGRFSEGYPAPVGSLLPGSRATLTIPSDRSSRPWRLALKGHGPVTVCGSPVGGTT